MPDAFVNVSPCPASARLRNLAGAGAVAALGGLAAPLRSVLALAALAALTGCVSTPAPGRLPAGAPLAAWVVMGEQGAALARAVTTEPNCPPLLVDGAPVPLQVRAAPATLPARPTATRPADSKPSAFPVLVCEAPLPAGARSASIGGQALPLPREELRRIVVLGDTGCRLVAASGSFQDCNDPAQFPFATVARAAAAFAPDLVVHVGDYHYREDACPAGRPACAGSPWGYGWDAWNADFFSPAAALLRAAPWVFARGNHETCKRAGQGYWRLIDPRPLQPGRDCVDPANDALGNHSDPYAVPLGADAQLLVFDTANTDYKGLRPGDPRRAAYEANYLRMEQLAAQAPYTIGVDHHPLLAYRVDADRNGKPVLSGGDRGLIDTFSAHTPMLLPASVQMLLSGHVHLWQQTSFASGHPTQFVAGFAGSAEDVLPLPATAPPGLPPAPGAVVEAMSSWVDGFGFMTLERTGAQQWTAIVHDRNGRVRNRCQVEGRHSRCAVDQVAGH